MAVQEVVAVLQRQPQLLMRGGGRCMRANVTLLEQCAFPGGLNAALHSLLATWSTVSQLSKPLAYTVLGKGMPHWTAHLAR